MSRAGTSMIELVFAVVIVGVGVSAVAALTATTVRTVVRAKLLDEAHRMLASFVDSASAVGAVGSGERAIATGKLSWSIPDTVGQPAWARVDHASLSDSVLIWFRVVPNPNLPEGASP